VSPARGPPTDWGELVQIHDDRDVFQATDRRTARDRYSQPLSGAGCDPRMSGNCERGRGLRRREKNATEAGAGRYEKPAPDTRAAPPEAHESLIGRKTVEEVALTGLSFARAIRPMPDPASAILTISGSKTSYRMGSLSGASTSRPRTLAPGDIVQRSPCRNSRIVTVGSWASGRSCAGAFGQSTPFPAYYLVSLRNNLS